LVGIITTITIVVVASGSLILNQLPAYKISKLVLQKTVQNGNFIELSDGAFGSLSGINLGEKTQTNLSARSESGESVSVGMVSAPMVGFGGGGGNAVSMDSGSGVVDSMVSDRMIMPYYEYMYEFDYVGDDFEIVDTQLPVYRLALDQTVGRSMAQSLSNSGINFVDLSKFKNTSVLSMHLSQEDGFNIYLNLDQGKISIDSNQQYILDSVTMMCDGPGCDFQEKKYSAVPDDQLIAIANKFLDDYGIVRSIYSSPMVDNSWKRYQEDSTYVPQMQSVVYPLSLDGNNVYESGGYINGMRVTVDLSDMRVRNVNEIFNPVFEKSNYEIETDFGRILKFAEKGGMNMFFYGASTEGEKLELGTPSYVYMHQYDYSSKDGRSRELYIPALKFPILNANNKNIYQDSIVVPIAKEILDLYDNNNNNGGMIPRPMPLIMETDGAVRGTPAVMPEVEAIVEEMIVQ